VDDDKPGPEMRDKVGVYDQAGYPNYPTPDADGYPGKVDVSKRLAIFFADFPDYYENMAHPNDYEKNQEPVNISYISHHKLYHNRLILRISWKTSRGGYVPMSFVCDTGAPMHFYLSDAALECLKEAERIKEDDLEVPFVMVFGKRATVQETPPGHRPGNIMGLLMLKRLGLVVKQDSWHLSGFESNEKWL